MIFKKNNGIIDERQELQSLKNAKLILNIIIILLGLIVVVETAYGLSLAHYAPELIVLMISCFSSIFLDIKQGNFYIKDWQNTKKNLLIYICSSFAFSAIICIINYIKYDFALWLLVLTIAIIFVILLTLMLIVDFLYRNAAKKKMEKLDKKFDDNINSEI